MNTCALCGEPTKLPPYCIECDMTGRSRPAETLRKQHSEVYAAVVDVLGRERARGE